MAIAVIIFLKRLRRHHKLTWVKWSHMTQLHRSHDLATVAALPCVGAPAETILLRSAVQASRRSEVTSSSAGFFTLSSVMIFCKKNKKHHQTDLPHTHSCSNFLYYGKHLALKGNVCRDKILGGSFRTFEEGLNGGTRVAMTMEETASGERSWEGTKTSHGTAAEYQ